MLHLTMTGFYAGLPLCLCDKEARKAAGDEFVHAMFWNEKRETREVCPECLKIWKEE